MDFPQTFQLHHEATQIEAITRFCLYARQKLLGNRLFIGNTAQSGPET